MKGRENFARNLRRLRKARKLSQEELVFRVDMDRTSVSNLERQIHAPNLVNAVKIAAALGVDVEELLKDPEN